MNSPGLDCYLLPASAVSILAEQATGGLAPSLTLNGDVAPYNVLDYFDRPLLHRGQFLLASGKSLQLINPNGEHISQSLSHLQAEFIRDIPAGPLKRALSGLSTLRRLLPVGEGQWQQGLLTLTDDEGKTHCRIHLLLLTAKPDRAAAIATLQGLKGYDDSLAQLRQNLQELGGAPYNGQALYQELFPAEPGYAGKADVCISPNATAIDAANHIIGTLLPLVRANEAGVIADHDTEFLHDYRVQLRKIRSVLSLFKGVYEETQTAELKARFSALMNPTGKLRDLDVYLLDKSRYYGLLPKTLHEGLDTLFSMFARNRTSEQNALAALLQSKHYLEQISWLTQLFSQEKNLKPGPNANLPAHDYARNLIWARYRKVCRIAVKIDASTPDEQVHELRIECKKLRYLMEFFSSMFPHTAFKNVLKPLKGLQENLGLFNDYSVQQISLSQAMQNLPKRDNVPDIHAAQSVGALIAVLHGRQLAERAKVTQNITQFNGPETRQAYRLLFQPQKDET